MHNHARATESRSDIKAEENAFYCITCGDSSNRFEPPTEFDQGLNDVSRRKIAHYLNNNENCWLGDINKRDDGPILRSYTGRMVFNFGADFIVPAYDSELIQLIESWRNASAVKTLDAIYACIKTLNGESLSWV